MPLGITPQGVYIATLDLNLAGYNGPDAAKAQQSLADTIARTPGISSVAYATSTPLSANQSNSNVFAPGTTNFGAANAKFYAQYFAVSPTYFAVAGTHLLRGRTFTPHDNTHTPPVVIVNETFARRLFGTADAVGLHFPTPSGRSYEIVGIVEDGKYTTLTAPPTPAMFWPILQSPDSDTVLLARSRLSPEQTLAALRNAIAHVDPGIPVFTLNPWPDALGLATFPARIATIALGVLGALAIMLALTGTFALANYTVSRRMREFGIRVALGAHAQQILRAALERTAWLLATGSLLGLALGLAAGKLLASIVYHATAADPLILAGVILTMACLGLLAAALPARRALHAEPAQLLREQ
jgi:predicted permease